MTTATVSVSATPVANPAPITGRFQSAAAWRQGVDEAFYLVKSLMAMKFTIDWKGVRTGDDVTSALDPVVLREAFDDFTTELQSKWSAVLDLVDDLSSAPSGWNADFTDFGTLNPGNVRRAILNPELKIREAVKAAVKRDAIRRRG